jgi:hypothetical protein
LLEISAAARERARWLSSWDGGSSGCASHEAELPHVGEARLELEAAVQELKAIKDRAPGFREVIAE